MKKDSILRYLFTIYKYYIIIQILRLPLCINLSIFI